MSPQDSLLPASFRGMLFQVEKSKDGTPRVFDVKTFPRRDGARLGDDGLGIREVTVEAYLPAWSDMASAAQRFRAAMLAPGTGYLSLPTLTIPRAGCAKCEQNFEKGKLGTVVFSLSFIADDLDAGAASLGALGAAISVAAAGVRAGLSAGFALAGGTAWQAQGVAAGITAAQAVAGGVLPGVALGTGLAGLTAVAAGLAVQGGAEAFGVAERLARG